MESGIGLNPTFHVPNCLFISQVHKLLTGQDGMFYLAHHPIRRVEIVGTAVKLYYFQGNDTSNRQSKGGVTVTLDDSTGLLECFCPSNLLLPSADSAFTSEDADRFADLVGAIRPPPPKLVTGLLLRVRGLLYAKVIRPSRAAAASLLSSSGGGGGGGGGLYKKLHVTELRVEQEPNALSRWILHVIRVSSQHLLQAANKNVVSRHKASSTSGEGSLPPQNRREQDGVDAYGTKRASAFKADQLNELARQLLETLALSRDRQLPARFGHLSRESCRLRSTFSDTIARWQQLSERKVPTRPQLAADVHALAVPLAAVSGSDCCISAGLSIPVAPDFAAEASSGPSASRLSDDAEELQVAWQLTLDVLARQGTIYPSSKSPSSSVTVWNVAVTDPDVTGLIQTAVRECCGGGGADCGAVMRVLTCHAKYKHLSWPALRLLLDKCVHDSLIVDVSSAGERACYKAV